MLPCYYVLLIFIFLCHAEKSKSKRGGLSKEKIKEIQSEIEKDRKKLESQKNMEADAKKKVEEELAKRQEELNKAQ